MATVIGVRFRNTGKVYYFDPCDFWPRPGQKVVVETMRGPELGEVLTGVRSIPDEQLTSELKKVQRMATEEDERVAENNIRREKEAFEICREKIAKHGLDMKLTRVEYTFDNSKIIFYFTSNGRVDFRELVKDLASVFHMRIELRQIGVRDEAKMLGGLGACGRNICCRSFLPDFQPVSIKMAKEQNLSLNPAKISGLCGRLMCCLKYEEDTYEQTLKRVPRVGKDIVTPDGTGVITEINAIRETVKVRINTSDDDFEIREYAMDDVRRLEPGDDPARREVRSDHRSGRPASKRNEGDQNQQSSDDPDSSDEQNETRKRYPRPKGTKAQSTDQFIEQMHMKTGAAVAGEEDNSEANVEIVNEGPATENTEAVREHHKRRRGGRGHRHSENGQEMPENLSQSGTVSEKVVKSETVLQTRVQTKEFEQSETIVRTETVIQTESSPKPEKIIQRDNEA